MKKFLKMLLALIISVAYLPVETHAVPRIEESVPIPINPDTGNQSAGNRSSDMVPIRCFYSNGELTFTFSATLGAVECEVVRVSDDEVFDATFYATNGGSDSLYVSTAPDDYVITLTCADGSIYYGEYSIE